MTLQKDRPTISMILTEAVKLTEEERAKLCLKLISMDEAYQAENTPPAPEIPKGASNG